MADGNGTSLMRAGGAVQAIVPHSFEEAWRVAGALAKSGMAPKGIDSQEQVLAVIMAGAEIGMPPFQALQSFAIINGRVSLWGDGMLAVVRKHGVKVEEAITGTMGPGEDWIASCTVTRPDTKEVIARTFSVADARKAGLWNKQGPWASYPKRMLQMRARSWALRDGCADLLRGLKMAEEVQDYQEPETARVVDEYDQRPPGEIDEARQERSAFIMGEAWNLVATHYRKLFEECDSLESLEKHWASFKRKYWVGQRKCISQNSFGGMEIVADYARIRFEKEPQIMARLTGMIEGAGDLDELGRIWSDAHTEAMVARLPEVKQREAQALYEAAQERFADAVLAELEASRKAPSPTRAALVASLEAEK